MNSSTPIGRILAAASIVFFTALWGVMIWWAIARNDDAQLTTLVPAGPSAESIHNLVWPVFLVAGLVFVGVLGAILYISMRFRERDDDPGVELPEQIHGKTSAEIGWTAAPAVLLAVIGFFTVFTIAELNREEPDSLQVEVYGQQWWWGFRYDISGDGQFDHPDDVDTATELVIPAGRPVQLTIVSNDVIHSFWIPALNGKRDAVPGNPNTWKLEANEPGVYRGQCTEFCGLSHANMRMLVRAIPADEFDQWVRDQQQAAPEPDASDELAVEGKEVFQSLCASCHLVDGVNNEQLAAAPPALISEVAPNHTHLMSRGTFAGSILNLHYPDNPETGEGCTIETYRLCGDPDDVSLVGNPDNPPHLPALEAWIRDPEAIKPMAPDEGRGMPDLGLTEDQIKQVVAYLVTLK